MNKIKIHLCSINEKTNQYEEIYFGLKQNKDVLLTDDLEKADYIIYNSTDKFYDRYIKTCKNKFRNFDYKCDSYQKFINIYKPYNHPEKEILLDWTDSNNFKLCVTTEYFNKVFLYFKRMCVNRKKNKSKSFINYSREIIPLPFAIRYDTLNYINSISKKPERSFDISCLFNGKDRGFRRDIYHYLKKSELNKKYKIFVGCIKRSKVYYNKVNCAYINQLLKSKIIVTSNPKNHEGDYRLYEALASGALVFSDQMLLPIENKLVNFKHLIIYKNMNHLDKLLKYYLQNQDDLIRIANEGNNYALKHHQFKNIVYFII